MKQHKLITSLSAITVFAAASATAQVTWQHGWTSATSFGDATNPTWSTTISGASTINDTAGSPATFDTVNIGNFAFASPDANFGPTTGDGITLEFRAKVNSQLGTEGAANLFAWGSGASSANKRHEVILTDTGVKLTAGGPEHTLDTSVFNDFRLTFDSTGGGGSSLYVNGGTTPVLTRTVAGSSAATNLLRIGDPSGSDQIGGVSEWEYVRWTNEGQFSPIPEPSSFAALFGFTALGFALSRRRVRS